MKTFLILLLTLFITFTEQVVCYFITANYTGTFLLTRKTYIKLFFELTFIWAIIFVIFPNMNPLIRMILGQLLGFCTCSQFEDKLKDKLLLFILTILTMFILEIPCNVILSIGTSTGILTNIYLRPLVAHAITFVVIYFSFQTPLKNLYRRTLKTSFAFKTILVYFYLLMISILVPIHANLEFLYSDFQVYFFPTVIMLISAMVLFYYEKVIMTKNSDIDYYQKNMPIYEDLIHGIRTNQHEFANRMQSLNALLSESEDLNAMRDNLVRYTSEYAAPIHSYSFLKLNMPLLAASLYNQSNLALAQEKALNVTIHTYDLYTKISEVLLSDLSNILIQNALEESKTGSVIYVSIDSDKERQQTSIEVRNPVDRHFTEQELSQFFQSGYTTKETDISEKHGYGLYFLSKTIHKKRGKLMISCSQLEEQHWITIQFII